MKKLICLLFGHSLHVHAKPFDRQGTRWLKCGRCKRDYIIDEQTRTFIPMDFEILDRHVWRLAKNAKA